MFVAANHAADWLSAFGLQGPWADAFGWTLLVLASGCLLLTWMLPVRRRKRRRRPHESQQTHVSLPIQDAWSKNTHSSSPATQPAAVTSLFPDTVYAPEDAQPPLSNVPPMTAHSTSDAALPVSPHTWSDDLLKKLDWKRFNAVCKTLFMQTGLSARVQALHPTDAFDLLLFPKGKSSEPLSIIRCKQWIDERTAHMLLRTLVVQKQAGHIHRATFITLMETPSELQQAAEEHGIRILGASGLLRLIQKRSPENQAALLQIATRNDTLATNT